MREFNTQSGSKSQSLPLETERNNMSVTHVISDTPCAIIYNESCSCIFVDTTRLSNTLSAYHMRYIQ